MTYTSGLRPTNNLEPAVEDTKINTEVEKVEISKETKPKETPTSNKDNKIKLDDNPFLNEGDSAFDDLGTFEKALSQLGNLRSQAKGLPDQVECSSQFSSCSSKGELLQRKWL